MRWVTAHSRGVHRCLAPAEQDRPAHVEHAEEEREHPGEGRHPDQTVAQVVHVAPEGELALPEVEAGSAPGGHRPAERERVCLGGPGLDLRRDGGRGGGGKQEEVGGEAELGAEMLDQARELRGAAGEDQPRHREMLPSRGGLQRRPALAQDGAERAGAAPPGRARAPPRPPGGASRRAPSTPRPRRAAPGTRSPARETGPVRHRGRSGRRSGPRPDGPRRRWCGDGRCRAPPPSPRAPPRTARARRGRASGRRWPGG